MIELFTNLIKKAVSAGKRNPTIPFMRTVITLPYNMVQ